MKSVLAWLRMKRVWTPLALFAVYTLFGFLVLPGILRGQIVQGIRKNRLFIVTHRENLPLVEARYREIAESFDDAL